MRNKLLLSILASSLLLSSAACNSTPSVTEVKVEKVAESIPQPGGFSNINNAKLKELIDSGVTLVDIRLEEEWLQTGIVEGSKTITLFTRAGVNPNFQAEFTAVTDPSKPVALICRTGNRTSNASKMIAQQLGYKNVLNVTHGITGWIAEKRPVVSYKK